MQNAMRLGLGELRWSARRVAEGMEMRMEGSPINSYAWLRNMTNTKNPLMGAKKNPHLFRYLL